MSRNLEFPVRGLLALLHERVKHHDLPPDHRAEENTRDSFCGFESQFKKPLTHRARVRHSEIGTVNLHAFRVPYKSSNKTGRKRMNLVLDSAAVKGDLPVHGGSIAYLLCTLIKVKPNLSGRRDRNGGSTLLRSRFGRRFPTRKDNDRRMTFECPGQHLRPLNPEIDPANRSK